MRIEEGWGAGDGAREAGCGMREKIAPTKKQELGLWIRYGVLSTPYYVYTSRLRAATATAVGGQQVIPTVMIDQHGGFAVDRDVYGLAVRIDALARLGIEFDQADVPKIGAIDQP